MAESNSVEMNSGAAEFGAAASKMPRETRTAAPAGSARAKSDVRPRDARQSRMAHAFSQVVAVLMRDANFSKLRIADLEWLVIPPIMSGQFRLAHAQPAGGAKGAPFVPVAVALWASVSPEVDKSLSENLDRQVWLRPNQWASGDILWLMAVAGDQRAVPQFVSKLQETEFKGRQVKLRTRGADGKVEVKVLAPPADPKTAS